MNELRPELGLHGRTHEQAVQENLADLIDEGDLSWRGADAGEVAHYLEGWLRLGGSAFIAEALWRYFELVNEGQS